MPDFDSLFRKYQQRLLLYTLKFVESESDALDIVQNIFEYPSVDIMKSEDKKKTQHR